MAPKVLKKIIPVLVAVVLTVLTVNFLLREAAKKKTAEFSGTVEATEVNIGPKVPGRVVHLPFREGDTVKKGDVLLRLDDREAKAGLERAAAGLEASKNALKEGDARLEAGEMSQKTASAEVALSEAEYEKTRVILDESRRKFQRIRKLYEEGFASNDDLDTYTAKYNEMKEALRAEEARVRAAMSKTEELASSVKAMRRLLETLRARVRERQADVSLEKVRLDDMTQGAPVNGTVAYRAFEPGEFVPAGATVLTVVDLSDKWVRIDLDETFVGRLGPGAEFEVRAGGLDRVFKAKVFEMGREAEFATQRDVTRGKQDIKTFRVKLRVEDPEGFLKPGMTVIASPFSWQAVPAAGAPCPR